MKLRVKTPWLIQIYFYPVFRFTGQTHEPQDVTGAWLLPPIANIVCSASGAIVAGFLDERRAIITVIVS